MNDNHLVSMRKLIACGLGLIGMMPLLPTQAAPVASSATQGIYAKFIADGKATHLGPVGVLSASAMPAYNKTATVAKFNKSIAVVPVYPTPTLTVSASNIASMVESGGIQVDFVSATADSKVATASFNWILNPPPPKGYMPIRPFLTITLAKVESSASFNHVFPSFITTNGSTTIGALSISGSLIDSVMPLEFSGNPSVNQVLFQSPTVTITLNKQTVASLISCTAGTTGNCTTTPESITTEAINIDFHKALIQGQEVTGQLVIASAYAD